MKFAVFAPDGAGAAAGAGAASTGDKGAGAAGGTAAGADKGGAAAGGAGAAAGAGGAGAGAGAADDKGAGAGGGAAGAGAGAAAGAASQPAWDADHWRTTWAGDDAKKKAFAERRTDLKAALDSAYAADTKIAELSAASKAVLPKDATPEQITQYRKDNGIPETPAGYFDTLPKAVVEGLDDGAKTMLTPYMGLVRDLNLPPEAAAKVVQVWQAEQERQIEVRLAADNILKAKTEDALRHDWGNNYRAEVNNINNLLSGAPEAVRDLLLDWRTKDGNGLLATPDTLRWFAQIARMINPYSVPVGNDGGALDQKGVDTRLAEIEAWMGAPNGSEKYNNYWKNPKAQEEYRTLVDARELMKKRSAA